MSSIPNVLAGRYASAEMVHLWSPQHKVVLERKLWLSVLRAQTALGVEVPQGVLEAYEQVIDQVDLKSIAARERTTRHDVKARIEEFCALAGHEHIHKGMTSRDLTENVEQLQIQRAIELVRDRAIAALARLALERLPVLRLAVVPRQQRHTRRLHQPLRRVLGAHVAHGLPRRPDECQPGRANRIGKVGILGEESVARVDGLRASGQRGLEDAVGTQVRVR